jgi:tRNA nucleotidyltransferase/poly(A) polymerase
LKVQEGSVVKKGQVIAARDREKQRLESQRSQLTLSLQKLQSFTPFPPTPPQPVPAVKALPPNSYLEHEAEGERAKAAISSVESEIETKKQEIAYLKELPNLDPIILEHEQAKLKQLKQKHTAAVRDYQLAVGKLQTAKNNRAYQEYQASLEAARRVEEVNQARSSYERQLAEYQQRLGEREFQVAQVKAKLQEVENAIASLATVKAFL